MIAWLNWFLGDVAPPAAAAAALCMAFDWAREREPQWTLLISSTVFMRHIRAYEQARSRTPGGSTNSPDRRTPSRRSGVTGPGVEARSLAQTTPPPAPPRSSVGVGDLPPQRPAPTGLPQSPVGGGHAPVTPPTGLSGDRR